MILRVALGVIGFLLVVIGVQYVGWKNTRADFKQYQAQVIEDIADAKAEANARISLNDRIQTEILNGVQINLYKLSVKYLKLRDETAGKRVSPLSQASRSLTTCPGGADAAARLLDKVEAGVLGVLESGDREIIKYQQLWQLDRQQQ